MLFRSKTKDVNHDYLDLVKAGKTVEVKEFFVAHEDDGLFKRNFLDPRTNRNALGIAIELKNTEMCEVLIDNEVSLQLEGRPLKTSAQNREKLTPTWYCFVNQGVKNMLFPLPVQTLKARFI